VPALSHTQIVVVLNEKVRADEPFTHNELHEWLVNEPINKLIRDGYVEDAGDGRIRVTEKGRKLKGPVPETAED
jgi:hypothetical protein